MGHSVQPTYKDHRDKFVPTGKSRSRHQWVSVCVCVGGGIYLHVLTGIILPPENQYVFKTSNNRNQVIRLEVSSPIFASISSVLVVMRSITFKSASREQVRVEDSYCKALEAWRS